MSGCGESFELLCTDRDGGSSDRTLLRLVCGFDKGWLCPSCAAALQARVEELEAEAKSAKDRMWENGHALEAIYDILNLSGKDRCVDGVRGQYYLNKGALLTQKARLERLKSYLRHKPECRTVPKGVWTGEQPPACDCGFEEAKP